MAHVAGQPPTETMTSRARRTLIRPGSGNSACVRWQPSSRIDRCGHHRPSNRVLPPFPSLLRRAPTSRLPHVIVPCSNAYVPSQTLHATSPLKEYERETCRTSLAQRCISHRVHWPKPAGPMGRFDCRRNWRAAMWTLSSARIGSSRTMWCSKISASWSSTRSNALG